MIFFRYFAGNLVYYILFLEWERNVKNPAVV